MRIKQVEKKNCRIKCKNSLCRILSLLHISYLTRRANRSYSKGAKSDLREGRGKKLSIFVDVQVQ